MNKKGSSDMAYWLFKSEPGSYAFKDLERDGKTPWDGVRNYQACNNMKAMKVGDLGFFYHSVKEKQIVGVMRVIKEYHLDPSDLSGRFGMVVVEYVKPFDVPVTLEQIKNDPRLQDLALVKQSRLSVMPIPSESWKLLLALGKTTL